jgi:hypothetical protein
VNVGSVNPYVVTMNSNHNLTAVFTQIPPNQYTLHVQVSGLGTTNATGDSLRNAGTSVAVKATANSGYQLDHWLLDNVNVGSVNPYVVTMNSNHNLTAVFTQIPSGHLFADGFESGNFIAWSGTSTTSGSANVASTLHHSGTYSGQFSVITGSGTRRAYCYENLASLTQLYANAWVYIADGLPLASGQSMWLIQFEGPVGTVLGSFGIRADASGSHWAVQSGNSPFAVAASSVPAPVEGQWYLLQAYYTHAATGKTIVLTVNGVEVVSLSQNTAASSNVMRARFGVGYYVTSSTASVYIDDVTIDS